MSKLESVPGTILDRAGVTIFDTRAMEWEESDYVPGGALRRVLARDDDGEPIVLQRWLPPAREADATVTPGGYHMAREEYFCLGGEKPHNQKDPGEPIDEVVFKEGWFLDRLPGSVHGGPPVPKMPTGVWWLGWMIVSDNPYVGVLESRGLTDELPISGARVLNALPPVGEPRAEPQPASATRLDVPGVGGARVLKSRDMDFEPHPLLPNSYQKVLVETDSGEPAVTVWALPDGPYPVPELPYRVSHRYRDFTYVLEGELTVWEFDGPDDEEGEEVKLLAGYFVDRHPGSLYGFKEGEASRTGCTLLHFRTKVDAVFAKEDDKHPIHSRTLNVGARDVKLPSKGHAAKPYATMEELQAYLEQLEAG